ATAGSNSGASVLPDFSLGETLTIDGSNDNMSLTIDGLDIGEIALTAGSYAAGESLASELQSRINGSTAMRDAGKSIAVLYDAVHGALKIYSSTFGTSSVISVNAVDTNTAATLGFSVG